jgi:hypothetical protein
MGANWGPLDPRVRPPAIGMSQNRKFEPDPRILSIIQRFGLRETARMYALDPESLRRYAGGTCQRTTRWWFELNVEVVERDLIAKRRAKLHVVR